MNKFKTKSFFFSFHLIFFSKYINSPNFFKSIVDQLFVSTTIYTVRITKIGPKQNDL